MKGDEEVELPERSRAYLEPPSNNSKDQTLIAHKEFTFNKGPHQNSIQENIFKSKDAKPQPRHIEMERVEGITSGVFSDVNVNLKQSIFSPPQNEEEDEE